MSNLSRSWDNECKLYITCEEKCFQIIAGQAPLQVECLTTNQEEADTRMLLHAKHAANE